MGSSEESTVTADVSRMRSVRAAIAASATSGAETMKSARWCSPRPKTSSPTCSASTASSTIWRMRWAGDTLAPVSGSGPWSPKVKTPISKGVGIGPIIAGEIIG